MKYYFAPVIAVSVTVGAVALFGMFDVTIEHKTSAQIAAEVLAARRRALEGRIREARERSSSVKGIYMTADVVQGGSTGVHAFRERLVALAQETEINGIVIDVKEVCGPDYDEASLKDFVAELRRAGVWTIARIVVFKDASQIEAHPEWYLKRVSPKKVGDECVRKKYLRAKGDSADSAAVNFWRDRKGGYWLDPSSEGARAYIVEFAKNIVDLGFNELQFDYIRFPSDGDVDQALYPVWDKKSPKYEVMRNFFKSLSEGLRMYKPEIILSADLFGYVATQKEDAGIGQRLEDIGNYFDYISFMVYPSHYYSGFYLPADAAREFEAVNFSFAEARANPAVVVERSLLFARDFLNGKNGTTTVVYLSTSVATNSVAVSVPATPRSRAKLRPWLEDFFHEDDRVAGRLYGVDKVRAQIDAAERAESHGWLLWNAANVYTEGALKKE